MTEKAGNATDSVPVKKPARQITLESDDSRVTVPTSAEKSTIKTSSDIEDDNTDGVPYDHGWAWMVLLGGVINYTLISAYIKTMGVFFVELLQHFQAPASHTALLFAIKAGVLSIAGMFIMNSVIGRLGCRKTAFIGGVLMSLSAILSSFANDLILLICLQAVLLGVADCMLGSTGEVLTASYFRSRRSLALGIIKAGSSVGSMGYPPLLALLVECYGLRGALLLTGAISLHALPAALLLRPTSYFRKKRSQQPSTARPETEEDLRRSTERRPNEDCFALTIIVPLYEKYAREAEATEHYTTRDCTNKDTSKRVLMCETEARFKSTAMAEEDANVSVADPCSTQPAVASDSQHTQNDLKSERWRSEQPESEPLLGQDENNSEILSRATSSGLSEDHQRFDERVQETSRTGHTDNATDEGRTQTTLQPKSLLQRLTSILDFSLFRLPSFVLLFFYYMFSPNINVGLDYFPALAEQQGLSRTQTAQLLSIVGGLDLLSRLSTGVVANTRLVPVPLMAGAALTALGAVYQCTRWMTSFGRLAVLAVFQGVLAGVVNALVTLLLLHVVGLPSLAKGIGFQLLAEGAFSSAFHPLMGYVRDRTGSYVVVYHATGGCLLTAALILLWVELVRRREQRPTDSESCHPP